MALNKWAELRRSEPQDNWDRAQAPTKLVPIEPLRRPWSVSRPARVAAVEHLGDFRLRPTFSDGLVRELDFDGILEGEVFEPLTDRAVFALVSVDTVAGTIAWPTGVGGNAD